MTFKEIESVEAFDFRMFESLPSGRWQVGLSRMLFGKYRVEISLKGSGYYTVSYWAGEQEVASLLCGFLLGVCFWLAEESSELDLLKVFPEQQDKDLSANFFKELFKASALAQSRAQAPN
jgi:hypothetical protein